MNLSTQTRRRRIRARATIIASLDYLLNISILAGFCLLGIIDLSVLYIVIALSVFFNALFLHLVISGKSESFNDPSLTASQVTAGCLVNLVALAMAPQVAYAIAINLFVPLAYGSLHFKREGFVVAWVLMTISFGTVLHFTKDAIAIAPTTALDTYLFAFVVSTALGRFLFINAEVSNIRRRLRDKNHALKKAFGLLREVTEKDDLTGMANRQAFTNILVETCSPLLDTKSFYVAMIEVDNVNKANESFSHDKAIRAVSDILSCRLRRSDTISRYNETRFALIFPEANKQSIIRALERARLEIEDINWEYYGVKPCVAASIGLAEWRQGDDPFVTLKQCENALSMSKSNHEGGLSIYEPIAPTAAIA